MPDVDLQERPPKAGKSRRAALPPAAAEDGAPQAQPSGVMRRIVLTSPKGGSGKTGTTRNLAVAAAMDGYKVATVDLDPQRSLTRWFEKRPDQATFIQHHEAHMRDVRAVLDEVSGFDLVLFDTPTAVEEYLEEMKMLVTACDLALVSTQETDDDLDSVTPWMKTLLRYQTKAAFVFNKVKPRTNMFMEAKNRLVGMGYPVCPVEVPDYTDIATAGNMGIGILELRASKGGEHMRGVWGFVRSTAGL